MPDNDGVRSAGLNLLNERPVVLNDDFQVVVKFSFHVIRRIGRLLMVHVEEVEEAPKLPASENVVASGRKQQNIGLARFEVTPELSDQKDLGEGVSPVCDINERITHLENVD